MLWSKSSNVLVRLTPGGEIVLKNSYSFGSNRLIKYVCLILLVNKMIIIVIKKLLSTVWGTILFLLTFIHNLVVQGKLGSLRGRPVVERLFSGHVRVTRHRISWRSIESLGAGHL